VVAGGFRAEVVPSNKGRTGVAFRVRLQSWGLAIASWIEAGGFARSYQEFNWLVDKGGQREQEAEVNSRVLETRFPGVTSGAWQRTARYSVIIQTNT